MKIKSILSIRKRLQENEALKNEIERLKKEKDEIAKDRDWAYGGCGVRDAEINFLKYRLQDMNDLHEEIVERRYENDNSRKKYICVNPFEYVDILRGEVYACCSNYLKHNFSLGNIYVQSFEEIWNSENAKKLRYSVTKGDFEYCHSRCKWLNDKNDKEKNSENPLKLRSDYNFEFNSYHDCTCSSLPKKVFLSLDEACNLTCPSCRNEQRWLGNEERKKLEIALKNVVKPMLKECESVVVSSSGEFFVMKEIQEFFKTLTKEEFPKLTIEILTNGQLLTEEKWDEFKNLHSMPVKFTVSIDAAEKNTYEKLRRGGKWGILCDNMKFVSKMKNDKKVERIQLNFVVQKENYKQIEQFVKLGEEWGVDEISFIRITNLGTYNEEEFKDIDVANKENPCYRELVDIMKKVLASNSKISIMQSII